MSGRDVFSPDDWRTLQFCPFWVFHAVAGADRKVDDKELNAFAKALQEAPLFKEELVREVLSSIAINVQQLMGEYKVDTRDVLTGLKQVADILDANASKDQAHNFKGSMLLIGKNVAEASGGFMGFGDKISDEEKTAIAAIAVALRFV